VSAYRNLHSDGEPTLPGTQCVLGVEAVWLQHVEVPDVVYDPARFWRDPVYARHLANFNLLTYLVENRDTRKGNVLVSTEPGNPRVFSVDNGIAFDARLYNYFSDLLVNPWQRILVPALPRDSIERLRAVTPERAAQLAVVAQMQVDGAGLLHEAPPTAPIDPTRGSRWRDGVFQLGLTRSEIDHVLGRVHALLARVDRGEIPLF